MRMGDGDGRGVRRFVAGVVIITFTTGHGAEYLATAEALQVTS